MYILLSLLLEVSTIVASSCILAKSSLSFLYLVGDMGYKMDRNALDGILKKYGSKDDYSKFRKVLNKILEFSIFIPGINIITSIIRGRLFFKDIKGVLEDEETKELLIPMDEYEKTLYGHLGIKKLKNKYMLANIKVSSKEDNKKVVGFVGDTPIVITIEEKPKIENNVCNLVHLSLPYMSYTFDEVKKLADSINGNYIVGNTEGRSIAIIGDMEPFLFNKVKISSNGIKNEYDFERYDEEEASKKRYVVFPYQFEMENNLDLMKCYEEIVKEREEKEKRYKEMDSLDSPLTLKMRGK